MGVFNIKEISPELVLRLSWYMLIAGIVVFYSNMKIVSDSYIRLSVLTNSPEVIQVFCDKGSGFSEALSSKIDTSLAQQNGEPFNLPLASPCRNIRIDLGGAGAIIRHITAEIVTVDGEPIDITYAIKSPSLLNDVTMDVSTQVEFTATGNDPYVVLSGEYSTVTTSYSLLDILKIFLLFVLAFCLIAASDYWVNKEDTRSQ